ncbi:YacP-like NYN domain protein [Phycisphaerae bacterium RAS1]|nr:YacP-like NYN domain protein [Phycisphaerae bacterium RAS1]
MPVLIDGNNLLHSAVAADPERPAGRYTLCQTLQRWAQRYKQRVQIIFDGPAPPREFLEQLGGSDVLYIRFSGSTTADAVIAEVLERDSAARRLLVVSSDHEIMRAAKRRRATPVCAPDFWDRVLRDLEKPRRQSDEPEEKRSGLGNEAGDDWLREFGLPGGS